MATTDTCPTCGNAHSGECTPAALKARIGVLSKDPETTPRHLLFALRNLQLAFEQCDSSSLGTINENLQPVADAAMVWISSLRRDREEAWKERDEARRERDTLRAQIASLCADIDRRARGDQEGRVPDAPRTDPMGALASVVALRERTVRAEVALAEANLTLLNERGEGEPPEPGWVFRVTRDLQGVWETERNGGMVRRTTARGWYWTDYDTGFNPANVHPTARAAMRAASKRLRGGS